MPNFYNGNEMVYPTSITLIDDSDPPDASHFNPTGETLADRTAYINRRFVNGYDGGTYNPSHPIIIGDLGLEMPATANWWFYGFLHFDGTIIGVGAPTPTVNFDGTNALLWLTSGAKMQVTSSSITFSGAGAGWQMQAGTSASMATGTELDIASGAHVFVAGPGGIHIESPGGSIEVDSGAKVNFGRGQDLTIADGTDPAYINSRSRTIAQPLALGPDSSTPAGGSRFDKIVDGGGSFTIACSKLIKGAQVTRVTVRVVWTVVGNSSGQLQFHRTKLSDGSTQTWFRTINTSATNAGGSLLTLTITSPDEFIDDELYAYTVRFSGETGLGLTSITWWAPSLQFTGITTLGQF